MLRILLFISFFYCTSSNAQFHQDVLVGQNGATLRTNLVNNYKPLFLSDYSTARTNMFNYVYKENDSVECVYTGLTKYLPSTSDPTAYLYDNGSNNGINTEHTYPQSKTTAEAGKADLHHIYPTRALTNTNRGSLPFGEIATSNVDKWYFEDQTLTSPPPSNVMHLYSKLDNNNFFEPRDEHKGNVARAMFYYYTMYQTNADAADPNFFNNQKNTLCNWHLSDPVDSLEWSRNDRIALYQSFKKNPFILDCTLAERCGYCSQTCTPPNAIEAIENNGLRSYTLYPNPTSDKITLEFELEQSRNIRYELYNALGQKLMDKNLGWCSEGLNTESIQLSQLHQGIYQIRLLTEADNNSSMQSKSFIVIP